MVDELLNKHNNSISFFSIFIIIGIIGFFSSCSPKKMEFSKYDRHILDTYQIGDTIMFISEKSDIDTLIISDRVMTYVENPYNNWFPQLFPTIGKIEKIKNQHLSPRHKSEFFSLRKFSPGDTNLSIHQGDFYASFSFNRIKKINFSHDCTKGKFKSNDNLSLEFCWDKKWGLYSYTDKKGVKWTKYNP